MKEARIYYISPVVAVMDNPNSKFEPVVLLRHPGSPSDEEWKLIKKALKLCGMELFGSPNFREDGLWYHPVRERR